MSDATDASGTVASITDSRRILITISVMLASIMQSIDNTIANVALPHMQGSVSASQDQISWVLTSYIISSAIMTPVSGWLATQYGRKRIFLMSVVGFTIASVFCGLSHTLPEIVLARLLQGVFGAALVPMSQAVLLDTYPPEKHARAMAIWSMGVVLGPIVGPALGGWLTEEYNWRWVFFINVPFGILSYFGILWTMQETHVQRTKFDFFGFSTLSIGIAALQLTLDRGQLKDWFSSSEIWIEATVAVGAIYLFAVHMLTTQERPFISASLFKDRNFLTGNVFVFFMGLVLFATLALLPPLLQDLLKYPVITAGFVTAPRGIGTLAAMLFVGRLMHRLDARFVIGIGFALTAYAMYRMSHFDLLMDSSPIIWSGMLQGLGTGFVYVPLASVTFATLLPALRNEGTALFSLLRNLGSSIGISVVEVLLTRNTQTVHASLGKNITPFDHTLHSMLPGVIVDPHTLAQLNGMVTEQATMVAYNNDFYLMMILCFCAIPLLFLLKSSGSQEAPEGLAIE